VGDFDSVDQYTLLNYQRSGGTVRQYPTDKNATDLELAIDLVDPKSDLTIVGGDGDDRFDHFVGELTHIASRAGQFSSVTVLYPHALIVVLSSGGSIVLPGTPGSIVSMIPMFGAVKGVTTTGLRWPLRAETLPLGTTRAMSNELTADRAEVSLELGTLLVVQPTNGATK
jgi:thiamine pyrophosphokinase